MNQQMQNFFDGVKTETPKSQIVEDVHPFELRDQINPICETCGRSTKQNFVVSDRRGNFSHSATKIKVRAVGTICECQR